jgi:UDP-3-O-[3-hydroxymyristoyl] N-acetylglucosamine deacetylase
VIGPADRGSGVCFVRSDLGPGSAVRADLGSASSSVRRTELHGNGVSVSTVEHLLSALFGLAIYDAEVRLEGAEVPILDGSAAPFVRALLEVSRRAPEEPAPWEVVRGSTFRRGNQVCHLLPADGLHVECTIEFPHPAMGRQWLCLEMGAEELYVNRVAPARTFGFLDEAADLRASGLARGASLRSVAVFGRRRPVSPGGSRYADEPVRHKLLDALGDLALLGGPVRGRLKLRRCSHAFLVATLRHAVAAGVLSRRSSAGEARAAASEDTPGARSARSLSPSSGLLSVCRIEPDGGEPLATLKREE